MKQILFCLLIVLSSCQSKHFEFDTVEHYEIDISDKKFSKLINKENKSADEIELETILTEDYPSQVNPNFIKNIDKLYPIKREIDKNDISKLSDIYYDGLNFTTSKCIPIYRDILIFKQNGSIVGISKICFDCDMQYTINKYGVYKEFDNNYFKELEQILK